MMIMIEVGVLVCYYWRIALLVALVIARIVGFIAWLFVTLFVWIYGWCWLLDKCILCVGGLHACLLRWWILLIYWLIVVLCRLMHCVMDTLVGWMYWLVDSCVVKIDALFDGYTGWVDVLFGLIDCLLVWCILWFTAWSLMDAMDWFFVYLFDGLHKMLNSKQDGSD